MEYADSCTADIAESTVREMTGVAMRNHAIPCKEIISSAIEATVLDSEYVTVISSIAMW